MSGRKIAIKNKTSKIKIELNIKLIYDSVTMIVANWKENGDFFLIKKYNEQDFQENLIILPPIVFARDLKHKKLGIQAPYPVKNTGEILYKSYKEIGINYILINHTEQKKYLTHEQVKWQIEEALKNNLKIIFCFEKIEDVAFYFEKTKEVFIEDEKVILIFEPGKCIGNADLDDDFEEQFQKIQNAFSKKILFGGSVNEKNIKRVLKQADGAIVGRASLDIEKIVEIVNIYTNFSVLKNRKL